MNIKLSEKQMKVSNSQHENLFEARQQSENKNKIEKDKLSNKMSK